RPGALVGPARHGPGRGPLRRALADASGSGRGAGADRAERTFPEDGRFLRAPGVRNAWHPVEKIMEACKDGAAPKPAAFSAACGRRFIGPGLRPEAGGRGDAPACEKGG